MTAGLPPIPPLAERSLTAMLERAAATNGDAMFAEFPAEGVTWTYAGFLADAQRVAGGLRELGLEPGDRIGIMLGNRPEFLLSWYGSLLAGTIDAPINPGLRGDLLAHRLRSVGVKAVVCEREALGTLAAVLADAPSVETLVPLDGVPGPGVQPFSRLLAAAAPEPFVPAPTSIASVRYTSGTTGPAKAVSMTHSRMYVAALHFAWLMETGPEDRLYTSYPLYHGLASGLGIVPTILTGGAIVVDRRFSASGYWPAVRRHGATLAHVMNPMIPLLLDQPPSDADADHACRRLWTGDTHEAFERRFATRLVYVYGQSEGGIMAFTPPGLPSRPGSCGRVSDLFEIQICAEDDRPVPAGEIGEILWRPREPHMISPGYFGDPEATVRAWQNLRFHSGDLGRMDADGHLYLLGRTGDQIRRKGVNISAEEIERIAAGFPGLVEAIAVAVPSELAESEIKLCVVPGDEPLDVDALVEHLRERLPRDMVPRYIEPRAEIPRTDTYKIAKAQLIAEGAGGDGVIDLEAARSPLRNGRCP